MNQDSIIEHRVSSIENRVSSIEHRASSIEFDKTFFKMLQEQITAYFDGNCVNFSPAIPIFLDGFTQFCSLVLTACREVKFGQTISYSQLAKKVGRPAASRAVGNALAKNPLPLIIPCHRVVRSPCRFASQRYAFNQGKPSPKPSALRLPPKKLIMNVWQPQAQDSSKAESKLGDGHLNNIWLNTYSQSEIMGGKLIPAQAGIGGFSAPGGISLKKKMLELERQALRA
jgi:O-6-methylguanine DNA methyltransferase